MKTSIIFLVLVMMCLSGHTQDRIEGNNNDLWFLQLTDYNINEKWGIENELHLRAADWGSDMQQFLIRPSVFYKVNQHLQVNVGYTYIRTYPYGDQSITRITPENNIWAQVTLLHQLANVGISHRYRIEERWIGATSSDAPDAPIDHANHKNRFRYRMTLKKPLGEKWYATAFDEIWIGFGENTGFNHLDQNWLYGGFGRKMSESITLEAGYLWQILEKADGIHYESNNTIQFTMKYLINTKNRIK